MVEGWAKIVLHQEFMGQLNAFLHGPFPGLQPPLDCPRNVALFLDGTEVAANRFCVGNCLPLLVRPKDEFRKRLPLKNCVHFNGHLAFHNLFMQICYNL
jgi:hypothetical protein